MKILRLTVGLNCDTVSQPVNDLFHPKFSQIFPKIAKFRPFFGLKYFLYVHSMILLILITWLNGNLKSYTVNLVKSVQPDDLFCNNRRNASYLQNIFI